MKHEEINGNHFIILSRRNLQSLLAKLDGHPPDSACMIGGGSDALGFFVKAEEDDVHYADRVVPSGWKPYGVMHPDTERAIRKENDGRNVDTTH